MVLPGHPPFHQDDGDFLLIRLCRQGRSSLVILLRITLINQVVDYALNLGALTQLIFLGVKVVSPSF